MTTNKKNLFQGEIVGILAGSGKLPVILAKEIKNRGKSIFAVGIKDITSEELKNFVDQFNWIEIEQIDKYFNFFSDKNIKQLIILGKFDKALMFRYLSSFNSLKKLLSKLPNSQDLSFFRLLSQEAENKGLKILSPSYYLSHLLVKEGRLNNIYLSEKELQDAKFGWKIAKKLAGLDIGQTVVVKNLTVLAVEAIEGTDRAILRGGFLGGEGTVVVKVARPGQDMRFDIPVVGPQTLMNMAKIKAKLLALEKDKVFLLNKTQVMKIAQENQISILGIGG